MELEALRKDMVAAMKAKDKVTKDAVSSLISAVKKVAIAKGKNFMLLIRKLGLHALKAPIILGKQPDG